MLRPARLTVAYQPFPAPHPGSRSPPNALKLHLWSELSLCQCEFDISDASFHMETRIDMNRQPLRSLADPRFMAARSWVKHLHLCTSYEFGLQVMHKLIKYAPSIICKSQMYLTFTVYPFDRLIIHSEYTLYQFMKTLTCKYDLKIL